MTQPYPYQNSALSIEERVADLLSHMTLTEKIAQLGSAWVFELLTDMKFDADKARKHMADGIGHITRVAGASSLTPADGAKLANTLQRYLLEHTRLGIPALVHEECCSGYMARNATCFPQIIGLASTWQPELAGAMAAVVREQMRAAGAHQGLSPVLDVVRDPRWGRVEETFGEDPYLTALMGVHYVRGLQGDDWTGRIVATAKHFVGYGVPDGGFNWNPAHIPARELREVYLLPFEAAVKEGQLQSVMNGYNELDGVPCAASEELLDTILRQEWGFDGVVVSDYFAVNQLQQAHQITNNKVDSAVRALTAGIDIELPNTDCYGGPLQEAVETGRLDLAVIDRSVGRLLTQKFALGLFEQPYVDEAAVTPVFDTPAQRQLARQIAQKSMVLLKNDGDLLPLDPKIDKLAVIGPQADTTRHLVGDYAYICHIESLMEARQKDMGLGMPVPDAMEIDDAFVPMHTILQALRDTVSTETDILYAPGCAVQGDDRSGFAAAVEAARQAEVALVFVGGKSGLTDDCTCGEARDRADLNLTGVQAELVEAIHATGTPVVLVLINGRPLSVAWAAEHVPAIVEAWLPGEEGAEAVAEVLFGQVNPGGKLPITVPREVGQIPIYYNHKPSGGRSHWKETYVDLSNKPLWPFGYGLSYTTFRYDNLCLSPPQAAAGESVQVRVEVTNTGDRPGDEVIQLYTRMAYVSVTRPMKELKGFKRITLEPGQTQTVTFELFTNQLGFYDQKMQYVVEPGTLDLMVGSSSEDLPLKGRLEITGETTDISRDKQFFSQVRVN
ncbi:MAG: glycoside hydrolase family 3 C-terminal domain-containing protein [Anaerolineales bacterium]|nr:glycoside hydrolase family 3 C-terminal domain-containing protein [Anaerolineales bacterium]